MDEQKEYYNRFLNKYIKIIKTINNTQLYYQGTVKAVFEDKLILDDRKLGEIPITYEGMNILEVTE